MRAARLISLVLLLQNREAMTAGELARELEVSERTVHRDARALGEAGVPVYAERGRAGGYRLVAGYRTRLTGLDRAEAEALFLAGLPGALRDMGLADAASAARLKVTAALPSGLRDAPASAAARFHLDAPGWFRDAPSPPRMAEVAEALWRDRVLRVRYRRGTRLGAPPAEGREKAVDRVLEPYGLVLKAGVWYLIGRIGPDLRVYRVDRFERVEATGDGFDRDPEFDLPDFWARRSAEFARSLLTDEVTLRLSPAGMRALPHAVDPAAAREAVAGDPDGQGWTSVTLPVESLDVAYHQLLSLGPEAEITGPPELRARMADAAARTAALYR